MCGGKIFKFLLQFSYVPLFDLLLLLLDKFLVLFFRNRFIENVILFLAQSDTPITISKAHAILQKITIGAIPAFLREKYLIAIPSYECLVTQFTIINKGAI